MDYDEFRQTWIQTLGDGPFRVIGRTVLREQLDLERLDRIGESFVEPRGDLETARPFSVTAAFRWRWGALSTARSATTDEDMLRWLLDRDEVDRVRTRRPVVRVDVTVRATLPWDAEIPLPSPAAWAAFAREAATRLEDIEPLVPRETSRVRRGRIEVLAGQSLPRVEARCREDGSLWLHSVWVEAMQLIEIPRQREDPDRRPDPQPHPTLAALFARVGAALHLWTELTDHLRPAR